MVDAIFLDTTALYTLGAAMTNPDFQELLAYRSFDWPCKICTSKVNWLEYLRQRKEQVLECHVRILQAAKDVDKLLLPKQESTSLVNFAASFLKSVDDLGQFYQQKADAVGLAIVPICTKVSLELLISLAIENVPPFERRNEKGFRDAVSLFSFFEYAQDQKITDVLVVSNDNLIGEAAKRFGKDYDLEATVVKSIPDANNSVRFDAGWIKQRFQMYANWGAMDHLTIRIDALKQAVMEINPYDRIKYAQQYLAYLGEKRSALIVNSIRFKEIAAASHDYRGTPDEGLFFRLICEMTALLQPPIVGEGSMLPPAEYADMPIELYGSVKVKQEKDKAIMEEIGPITIYQAAPPAGMPKEIPDLAVESSQ